MKKMTELHSFLMGSCAIQSFFDLQYQFHSDLLRLESAGLVKAHSRSVTAPHVERQIIASALTRVRHRRFVQRLADVIAAAGFINAKIIDIQRLDVGQYGLVNVLLIDAKAIT